MDSFQILLNNNFTAATATINSSLESNGNYLSYINSNGGGIVNAFNVRGFLNDSKNQQVTTDFFAYLTGNTTNAEAVNILSSDQKLANVFNSYYQNFVLSISTLSNTVVIDQSLTGTYTTAITEYFHPWSGDSQNQQITLIPEEILNSVFSSRTQNVVFDFTDEQSYYIPVSLNKHFRQIPRLVFEPCDSAISKETQSFYPQYSAITQPYFDTITSTSTTINTLIQCFVDLNLIVGETVNSGPEISNVTFGSDFYMADEGTTLQVKVSLNKPSKNGFEEATIILNPFGATLNSDFTPLDQYPYTLLWAVGEQDKFLNFTINSDFEEEVIEPFILTLVGAINLNIGLISTTTVYIKDKTVLNYAGIVRPFYPADNSGVTHLIAGENNDIDFFVQLDHPAYGVETVVLEKVSVLNTINGNVGPAAHPLLPSEYILQILPPGQPGTVITLPYTISFNVGEINKSFLFFIKDNSNLEPDKTAYFQLSNQQFCKIDQSQRMLELTAKDDDGKYKYAHLNFGKIYSEFGDGLTNTEMRMIDPQTGTFGAGYPNIYVSNYSNYLIEYGKTITFKDYSNNDVQTVSFTAPYVKAKITNIGTIQSFINGTPVNPGQSLTVVITGNDFILGLTTNANINTLTNFYDDAKYKIELINNYTAISITTGFGIAGTQAPNISGFNPFKLMSTNNATQVATKTLDLGAFTIAGYVVSSGDTTYAYHLKSKYIDINTSRETEINTFGLPTGNIICPVPNSPSNNVSYSQFHNIKIENISVFGIIFLNYNQYRTASNNYSKYNGFDFVDYTQVINYNCNRTTSEYSSLNYINLPFILEP